MAGAATLLMCACGSSSDGTSTPPPDCSMKVTLSGAVSAEGDGSALVCADTNNGPGPTTATVTLAMASATVSLAISQFSEGDTGDFPASLFIGTENPAGQWITLPDACTVSITKDTKADEHDGVRVYQIIGTGTCAGDGGTPEAQQVSGTAGAGAVTISDFSFTARVGWTP